MDGQPGSLVKFLLVPPSAIGAAKDCGQLLRAKSNLVEVGVSGVSSGEVCEVWDHENGEDLVMLCSSFVQTFPPLMEESASEILFNAVRFPQAVNVPMTPGVDVDLVPAFISSPSKTVPTISQKPLDIGKYVRLTHKARVENIDGCCICLLVLSR